MSPRKHLYQFWMAFSHPKVFVFIVLGAGIIFLTFFTDNNALEIAISGFASVFIGIGVNNFSSFETALKDARKLESYLDHSRQILKMTQAKINSLQNDLNECGDAKLKAGLTEVESLLTIHLSFIDHVKISR